jgi:hypothetical protein
MFRELTKVPLLFDFPISLLFHTSVSLLYPALWRFYCSWTTFRRFTWTCCIVCPLPEAPNCEYQKMTFPRPVTTPAQMSTLLCRFPSSCWACFWEIPSSNLCHVTICFDSSFRFQSLQANVIITGLVSNKTRPSPSKSLHNIYYQLVI